MLFASCFSLDIVFVKSSLAKQLDYSFIADTRHRNDISGLQKHKQLFG